MPKSEASTSAGSLTPADQEFVSTASEAGAAEVAMAKVATDRAASVEVKNFASRMTSDHEKVGDKLKTIASNKHIDVKDQPSKRDKAEIEKLSKLSGASFDREYVKEQLSAHKEAVALFQKESKSAKDSDLKQFAANSLPTLEDHLRSVEQLSKALTPSSHASTSKGSAS